MNDKYHWYTLVCSLFSLFIPKTIINLFDSCNIPRSQHHHFQVILKQLVEVVWRALNFVLRRWLATMPEVKDGFLNYLGCLSFILSRLTSTGCMICILSTEERRNISGKHYYDVYHTSLKWPLSRCMINNKYGLYEVW